MRQGNMPRKKAIILASASPRRKALMDLIGLEFTVDTGSYEETMDIDLPPSKLAKFLSLKKAEAVTSRHRNAVIVAADTFIVFHGELMGKPRDAEEARKMLRKLSGKTHSVITGYTIIDTEHKRELSRAVETKVTFRRITGKEIDAYVRSKEPLDKAGAYAIQGLGAVFVRRIEGDYFNVIGLPLNSLVESLKGFGISIF
jgi:septum formation protein